VSTRPISWILAVFFAAVAAAPSHAGGLSFTTNDFNQDGRIDSCSDLEMKFWNEDHDGIVTARRSQTLALQPLKSLKVEAADRGGVYVQPSTDGRISAFVCMAAGATSEKAGEGILDRLSVKNDGGMLRVDGPGDDDWAAMIVLSVPNGLALDLSATNGQLRVGDVDGRFTLRTTNGPIKLVRVKGVVDAQAHNGPIKFVGHAGDVTLAAQNGPIAVEMDAAEWSGKGLDASTKNGPLKLNAPDNVKTGIEVTTSGWSPVSFDGGARSRISPWGGSHTYHLGGDQVLVHLSTVNVPLKLTGPVSSKQHGVKI